MSDIQSLLQTIFPYLLIVAGIGVIVYTILKKSLAEGLEGKGVYTDAIIFKQGYTSASTNDDFSNAPDKITVRFATASK